MGGLEPNMNRDMEEVMMEGYIETKMMGELDVARRWFDVSSSRRKTCEDDPS